MIPAAGAQRLCQPGVGRDRCPAAARRTCTAIGSSCSRSSGAGNAGIPSWIRCTRNCSSSRWPAVAPSANPAVKPTPSRSATTRSAHRRDFQELPTSVPHRMPVCPPRSRPIAAAWPAPHRLTQGIWTAEGNGTNLPRPEMQQLGSVLEPIRQPGVTGNECSRLRAATVQRIAAEVIGLGKQRVHRSVVDPRAPSGNNLVEESTHCLRAIIASRARESTLAALHPCRSRGAERLEPAFGSSRVPIRRSEHEIDHSRGRSPPYTARRGPGRHGWTRADPISRAAAANPGSCRNSPSASRRPTTCVSTMLSTSA